MNPNFDSRQHPDAHPIYVGRKNVKIQYDESQLSEEQKLREECRKKRSDLKKEKKAEEAGVAVPKTHLYYVKPFAGITDHDFDGGVQKCTHCEGDLVGTAYVYPLSQMSTLKDHPVLVPPFCLGCQRLFKGKDMNEVKKQELITWILFGKHADISSDDDPTRNIKYGPQAREMRNRAFDKLSTITYYDHPLWSHYKSRFEIQEDFKRGFYKLTNNEVKKVANIYIEKNPHLSVVDPNSIEIVNPATAQELRDLVSNTGGIDAITKKKCSTNRQSDFAISFDHIAPISKFKFKAGSASIANMQLLTRHMNRVKADLPNRESKRWFTQLKKIYAKKYL